VSSAQTGKKDEESLNGSNHKRLSGVGSK